MIKFIKVTYISLIHAVLLVVLLKSNFIEKVLTKFSPELKELTQYYSTLLVHHESQDKLLSAGTVIFIGDSITQGLATSAVINPSINYGIEADTTYGVLQRIDTYKSIKNAATVILAIGINDLTIRTVPEVWENYRSILTLIPSDTAVIVSGVLPVNESSISKKITNKKITELNEGLRQIVADHPNITYLDSGKFLTDENGTLSRDYDSGDGLHLSHEGYKVWIELLKKALAKTTIQ